MKLEPGSVVLSPDEVARLRSLTEAWRPATNHSMLASLDILIDLADTVRELLTQASDDERKPVVR